MKKNAFVGRVHHNNPKQVFDPIGKELLNIFIKRAEAGKLLDRLWQLYLQDCNRHDVVPVSSEEVTLQALSPFPCDYCHKLGQVPRLDTLHINMFLGIKGNFRCEECGRLCCHHISNHKKSLCADCAAPEEKQP